MRVRTGPLDRQRVLGDQPFEPQPAAIEARRDRAAVELGGVNLGPAELDESGGAGCAGGKGDRGVGSEGLVAGGEIQPDVVMLDRDQGGSLACLAARQIVVYRPTLGAALPAQQQRS